MIISFFNRNQPGVKGTINTDGEAPSATGVGEAMLKAWMDMHEGEDPQKTIESLEAFYSSWANQGGYSAVEPSGVAETMTVVASDPVRLVKTNRDGIETRVDGEWQTLGEDENFSGKVTKVTDAILEDWEAGKITAETDLSQYTTGASKTEAPKEPEEPAEEEEK